MEAAMNYDGTNVDPEELRKFSKGAHDRAQTTTQAANNVESVHMGPGMLGVFSQFFLDDANNSQQEVLSKLRSVAATLSADGSIATTNAEASENTNTAQISRFANKEMP
jgi:hypothetical protein